MDTLDRRDAAARIAALLCAAGALAWPAGGRAQGSFELPQLMQLLAQVTRGQATFTEKRSVSMLERPLEFAGRLSFEAPDTFVRETIRPRHERLAVVGNTLTMSLPTGSRTVPLDSVPQAAVIIEAIRGTLTGNREAIEQRFGATVSGNAAHWSLELVPREARLRELVTTIRVAGRRAVLEEVTVTMADGDQSVMSIDAVAIPPAPAASPAS